MDTPKRSDEEVKAQAKWWVSAEYLRCEAAGERRRRAEVNSLVEAKFGIKTKKVMDEIWAEADIPNWRKSPLPKKLNA